MQSGEKEEGSRLRRWLARTMNQTRDIAQEAHLQLSMFRLEALISLRTTSTVHGREQRAPDSGQTSGILLFYLFYFSSNDQFGSYRRIVSPFKRMSLHPPLPPIKQASTIITRDRLPRLRDSIIARLIHTDSVVNRGLPEMQPPAVLLPVNRAQCCANSEPECERLREPRGHSCV